MSGKCTKHCVAIGAPLKAIPTMAHLKLFCTKLHICNTPSDTHLFKKYPQTTNRPFPPLFSSSFPPLSASFPLFFASSFPLFSSCYAVGPGLMLFANGLRNMICGLANKPAQTQYSHVGTCGFYCLNHVGKYVPSVQAWGQLENAKTQYPHVGTRGFYF